MSQHRLCHRTVAHHPLRAGFSRSLQIATLVAGLSGTLHDASAQCAPSWVQRMPATSPGGSSQQAIAFDTARNVSVMFGGSLGSSIWEWNGANWASSTPATNPGSRGSPAMSYDPARGVCVLFGGLVVSPSIQFLGDTWEWNGAVWVLKSPQSSPPGRRAASLVYDTARSVTLMHGGQTASGLTSETWTYNGTTWTQLNPAHVPPTRFLPAMAFDSARGVAVLFGGSVGSTTIGDTWEWNGADWTQRTPAASPPARYAANMVFDSARGVCVLFGGNRSNGPAADDLNDTWEWDGTNWTQRAPSGTPAPRAQAGAAYDRARQVTVLFGGTHGGSLTNDTWELVTAPAPTMTTQPTARSIVAGHTAMFNVVAGGGNPPTTYRWRRNGVPLVDGPAVSGSASATLTVGPAALSDNGAVFDVVVNNACGWAVSTPATLTVSSRCPADFDGSGALNVQDIFNFLSAWFAGCP